MLASNLKAHHHGFAKGLKLDVVKLGEQRVEHTVIVSDRNATRKRLNKPINLALREEGD